MPPRPGSLPAARGGRLGTVPELAWFASETLPRNGDNRFSPRSPVARTWEKMSWDLAPTCETGAGQQNRVSLAAGVLPGNAVRGGKRGGTCCRSCGPYLFPTPSDSPGWGPRGSHCRNNSGIQYLPISQSLLSGPGPPLPFRDRNYFGPRLR
jgi:hypothetical protein